jgi:radical SAM protein with 4Fe4S-binding SPASM domain
MDWSAFRRVVAELAQLQYSGWLAFHNYNEPLLNPRLYEELKLVQDLVPDAKTAIYTNGDLLTRNEAAKLLEHGVKYLRVTRYPHKPRAVPDPELIHKWLRQSGLSDAYDWQFTAVRQGTGALYVDSDSGVKIEVISPSITTYNSRGGTARVLGIASPRTAPCLMTTTSLSIDYNGQLKMCCNVFPDAPDHKEYIVENLSRQSLTELWSHPRMELWRDKHAQADWSASPACRFCPQALPETRR